MLSWNEYLKKGIVRRMSLDKNIIISLVKTAKEGIEFFEKDAVTDKNARTLFKNYYDSLREICEAVALSKGYKIYQHEAITSFLKDTLNENIISLKFDRFRILRNGIHYYGKTITKEETLKFIQNIKEIIKILVQKYLKEYL